MKEVMEKVEVIQAEQKAAASKEAGADEKAEDQDKEEQVIDIEPKEEITFDDFMKMQFQVGEIGRASCRERV